MIVGRSFTSRGQRYDCIGDFEYERPATWVQVFTLRSVCPDGGRRFECTASRTQRKNNLMPRRCERCRSPWPTCIDRAQYREGEFEHEMRKSDVLRLHPGDKIRFGDSMWSRKCDHNYGEGKVLFVTARGGVRVQTDFGERWVPYHHVLRKMHDHHKSRCARG
jgi:hypothetical protein